MGTVTRDERKEALEVYAACVRLLAKSKKRHLRAPQWVINAVQEHINQHWEYLKEAERLTIMFSLTERKYLDVKYVGPLWKICMATWWLKDKCSDLCANFIWESDKRLN